jgi:hypothetical protein
MAEDKGAYAVQDGSRSFVLYRLTPVGHVMTTVDGLAGKPEIQVSKPPNPSHALHPADTARDLSSPTPVQIACPRALPRKDELLRAIFHPFTP